MGRPFENSATKFNVTTSTSTSYDETTRLGNNSSVGEAPINLNASSKINSKSIINSDDIVHYPAYSGSTDFAHTSNFAYLAHNIINAPLLNMFNNTASNNYAAFRNPDNTTSET